MGSVKDSTWSLQWQSNMCTQSGLTSSKDLLIHTRSRTIGMELHVVGPPHRRSISIVQKSYAQRHGCQSYEVTFTPEVGSTRLSFSCIGFTTISIRVSDVEGSTHEHDGRKMRCTIFESDKSSRHLTIIIHIDKGDRTSPPA